MANCFAQKFYEFKGNEFTDFKQHGGPVTPSICMVTADANSINNIIYWDKTSYTDADSFIVYREVSASIYKRIGSVHADSLSEFVDTARSVGPANGDPNTASYRYKLQVRDTLGNYSGLSPYHSTIYIVDGGSGLFTWSIPYTIEGASNPVTNYVLLCDTLNTNVWGPVNTVSGSQSAATDPNFTNHSSIANWRVKTGWSISCTPTRATVNTSRSNIKHATSAVGINSIGLNSTIAIYPNPANDHLTLEINDMNENATLKIINVLGQVIEEQIIVAVNSKTIKQIDISTFAKGLYTVTIESKGFKAHKKLVVN